MEIKIKSPEETNPDVRFSMLKFIKSLPKWYSKKMWALVLSFSAISIGAIIFAFFKFGICPGIVTWIILWGVGMIFWNIWWKKNSTEFILNITNVIEKCMVDKDGNPIYVD